MENSEEFDISDYNKNHEYCDLKNKKVRVISKFKDKLNGIPLREHKIENV